LLPPENFFLLLGAHHGGKEGGLEKNSQVAQLLREKLNPKSLLAYPCGADYTREDLCCKTGAVITVARSVVNGGFEVPLDKRKLFLASRSRGEYELGKSIPRSLVYTPLPRPNLAIDAKLKNNPPSWVCVFDDDIYVHVEKVAHFLQTLDPSTPKLIGPFCTVGRRVISENMLASTGIAKLPTG